MKNNNFSKLDLCLKKGMRTKMEKNQTINCTVASCKYNNNEKEKCMLESIQVEPIQNCNTKQPDESMCASYKSV